MARIDYNRKTLKRLREMGFLAQVVEKWIIGKKSNGTIGPIQRKDLFGVIDVLAINNDATIGIQVTSASNHANRRKKMLKEPMMITWLGDKYCGRRLEVWSWRKVKNRWRLRRDLVDMMAGCGPVVIDTIRDKKL